MASYKYIGGDGVSYGPYTLEQMREFKAQNRVAPQSQVSADGGPLKPASSHPELKFESEASIPPVIMPGPGMGVPVQNTGVPLTYDQVPWHRREGTMSIFIVLGFCFCPPFGQHASLS